MDKRPMDQKQIARSRGFSLVELLIAMGVGLVVVGAATKLYTDGLNAAWSVSQKTQMQQDGRAALDLLTTDIRMAGTGVGSQTNLSPALASGGANSPKYGCDGVQCYVNNGNGINFPAIGGAPALYPVIPGYQKGKIIDATKGATDVITLFYADTSFHLSCYRATVATATTVVFDTPNPQCYFDSNNVAHAPENINDPAIGLKPGDVVYFSSNAALIVGEVTNVAGLASPYTVTFADPDALKLNQASATANSFPATAGGKQINVGAVGTANRLFIITYYLDIPAATGLPTLMRQVSGHTPTPVAENISDLEFSYEIFDSTASPPYATYPDANLSINSSPNLIKKVNIKHLTMRSTMRGTKGYQGIDLQSSLSVRSLGFHDQFPLTPTN